MINIVGRYGNRRIRCREALCRANKLRKVVQRCVLMTTDPGDLVLDPTCGSGTTAYVAEQWGRRWITIDTSRVPLALARQRLLTATFPYYELKDPGRGPAGGFVYKRKQNRKGEEIGRSRAAHHAQVDRERRAAGDGSAGGPPRGTVGRHARHRPVRRRGHDRAGAAARGRPATASTPASDPATHIERMTEVLRQSKTLRLPGNRELTLAGIRRTADAEYLHAEAKEGDKRIAIVFGPQDGAVSQ